jgi:hypothetical protein
MLLVDFLLWVTPGGTGVFFLLRWVKGKKVVVSGLRMDAVRADAELEAAREAARVAQGREREQRAVLGDAVQVARAAVHTDQIVTQLAEFLKDEVGWRSGDVPALPGAPGWEPSAGGELEEGGRP